MHVTQITEWTWAGHVAHLQDNRWTSQDPWRVVKQDIDPRRDGVMKSRTSGDLLNGRRQIVMEKQC